MLPLALAALLLLGAPDAESDAFTAAYALKKQGKSAEAAAAFERIAASYPESARLGEALVEAGVGWFAVGRARLTLHRSNASSDEAFARAREHFSRVATGRPSDPVAGRAQYMLGSTALFQGDLAAAEADYGVVLEKHAGDAKYVPKALERRAAVRRHLLQDDLALADLRRYLELYPKGEEAEAVARYVEYAAMNGKPAPKIEAETWLQGGPLAPEAFRGRVVGWFFFATWCEKCEAELPFLVEIERRSAASGFVLVGVLDRSKGQTPESVKEYLARQGLRFPAMIEKPGTRAAVHAQSIPDLVLVDKAGRVRWHDHPANLTDYTIETLLGE